MVQQAVQVVVLILFKVKAKARAKSVQFCDFMISVGQRAAMRVKIDQTAKHCLALHVSVASEDDVLRSLLISCSI